MIPPLPLNQTWGGGPWAAALIGAGFGFALERAGLGSPRKLAGQFYGYDFVVIQVMLTAIVTAMIGLQLLSAVGALDLGRVYLPPTFLIGQGVGGLLFGVGFVVGGYCPGTCFVGAAGGRLDALMALGGMLAGMLVYSALLARMQPLANANALGPVTLPQLVHLPPGWVAAAIAGGTLALFAVIRRVERGRALPVTRA